MSDNLTPSPAATAQLDQDRAELLALVTAAAEHTDAEACPHRGRCPGQAVTDVLQEFDADELDRLLRIAVAELARLGYTRPPGYSLTRTGYAVLDAHRSPPWPFGSVRA
ncbi:hypothetical protein JNW90_19885 [Micromonospora sp. STR1s_5]|nr:hypothetical protein [Micromonospora sp. STR1s_5]